MQPLPRAHRTPTPGLLAPGSGYSTDRATIVFIEERGTAREVDRPAAPSLELTGAVTLRIRPPQTDFPDMSELEDAIGTANAAELAPIEGTDSAALLQRYVGQIRARIDRAWDLPVAQRDAADFVRSMQNYLVEIDGSFGARVLAGAQERVEMLREEVLIQGAAIGVGGVAGAGLRVVTETVRAARGAAVLSAGERAIVGEARGILSSSGLASLRAAHAAGVQTQVAIGGRTIVYVPGYSGSGVTLFGENGFILGRHAFSSHGELGRTLLHELYRLGYSGSAGGASQALVAQETAAAAGFAERAAGFLGL